MNKETIYTLSIVLFIVVTLFYLSPIVLPKNIDSNTGLVQVQKPIKYWTEKMLKLGLDLRGGMELTLEVDTSKLPKEEHDDAVKTALKIIQNRIDEFGVAEPSIQRSGEKEIIVQLPGLKDFDRAKDLIKNTAQLEFKLVATFDQANSMIKTMDKWLSMNYMKYDFLKELEVDSDNHESIFDDVDDDEDTHEEYFWYNDIMSQLVDIRSMSVDGQNKEMFKNLIKDQDFQAAIPNQFQILPGKDSNAIRASLPIYILYSKAELTGDELQDASTRINNQNELGSSGRPIVSLKFKREGSRKFESVTAQNINRNLAIVLDNVVYVAPVIQNRIRGGEAQITGNFTLEECKDIVIVLKAGNLPAPVNIIKDRIVGPSLGSDSIKQGSKAFIIAICVVIVFIVLYYQLSGLIASLALILNTAFIFAALTFFEATLTLPGIAGIILTIGMAVDANVLIFERIKEELKAGKNVRTAIAAGYDRATITILDSNITTLITAAVLFKFGSGPIKGFAITMAIGILASMFTAIILTKKIFDIATQKHNFKSLSIGSYK